ncbi:MAG: cyclic nucleotide-binding domain-containing protein [Cyanobacteria bacterium P01_A01_bin.83]
MTETLLQELNNSDIDWIIATGKQQQISAETKLMSGGDILKNFYILLEGSASVILTQEQDSPLTQAFATLEGKQASGLEVMRLSPGEVVGENIFTELKSQAIAVETLEQCLVISLSLRELKTKILGDKGFAARFYRSITILYLNRLQLLLERLGRRNFSRSQTVRDVLHIFSKLHDSDLDWAIANGTLKKISAQTSLIRQGGPVDALYILLDGQMNIALESERHNPLTNIFATLEETKPAEKEIAKLNKGQIIGETSCLDGRSSYATITALEDSVLLALPRPLLIAKLQQDLGFAARFYSAIAALLADKLQEIISRLSVGRRTYVRGKSLNEKIRYEDELDTDTLEQMSIAATRFDWMLERLRADS